MPKQSLLRKIAQVGSSSPIFAQGRRLWERNRKDWNYPLSKWDKVMTGGYVILKDFADGIFPPRFEDQAEAYRNEAEYNTSIPGVSLKEVQQLHATKPFWDVDSSDKHLNSFVRMFRLLLDCDVKPGQSLLELGCGSGWLAEMLASAGYCVTGTTISPYDLEIAMDKAAAHVRKKLPSRLEFTLSPMESLDKVPGFREAFDAAYVYESLHHAFDWRKTLRATARTLRDKGWLLIAQEPNRLHTFISYRVAKLSRTHEIGFIRRELLRELEIAGFSSVKVLQPKPGNWVSPFWIAGQKA